MDHIPPGERRVLDLFCGAHGEMYRKIWHNADKYLGIDKKEPHKLAMTMQMDNKAALRRLNHKEYNIYDCDAYGQPYDLVTHILRNPPPAPYVVAITDGSLINPATTTMSAAANSLVGIRGLPRAAQSLVRQDQPRYRGLILQGLASIRPPVYAYEYIADTGMWYFGLVYL